MERMGGWVIGLCSLNKTSGGQTEIHAQVAADKMAMVAATGRPDRIAASDRKGAAYPLSPQSPRTMAWVHDNP